MAINYSTTAKSNRMQVSADLLMGKTIAAATGTATAGSLVIGTSGLSGATGVLVTIPLNSSVGTVSNGVLTLATTPSALSNTASASGTAALAELRSNTGTVIISGLTVGTSGTDIVLGSTAISANQTVTVSSAALTHA